MLASDRQIMRSGYILARHRLLLPGNILCIIINSSFCHNDLLRISFDVCRACNIGHFQFDLLLAYCNIERKACVLAVCDPWADDCTLMNAPLMGNKQRRPDGCHQVCSVLGL